MYSRVFEVYGHQGRLLFYLVKSARGGPLESVGSQSAAGAVARHEDGEYLWAIRATNQARDTVEWITAQARLTRVRIRGVMLNEQPLGEPFLLESVTPPGLLPLYYAIAVNGDVVGPVSVSESELREWLAAPAAPLTIFRAEGK